MPEERRVVSVLFADVTGSTALGESTDPEDVRALLGRYYAVAKDVVAAHGGTLEKFIGDAVMAIFGIPQAHGDDAERALAAALSLRERVAAEPATAGLVLRIGVNTGEVVATRETDAGDFLVTGDAVNVAARLQQGAEPGTIVAGERTRRAVMGFRFAEEQHISAKGKREPIVGSVLLGRVTERRAPRAPFVGRDHDLAQLRLVADRAFSEHRPHLVTITAPAGTGKSRLVDEFVGGLGESVTVATAQCLPYGSAVTFLPLRGLVHGLLHATDGDEIAQRLRSSFAAAGYAGDDATRLAALIGTTLGDTNLTERHDRDEIFSAWRLLIEALAARGPHVVVFEDLHWASDTLLDLVEHVTIARTQAPLVMVALARPELLDRRAAWGGGRRSFTSLALEPLTETETRTLVNVLTEGVPRQIADRIVERAGGNPFFAGELVRAYEASHREGVKDNDVVLPDTVHATVLARIDGLAAEERSILEYAAVAGRTARARAVHALVPQLTLDTVRDTLEALVERELLVPQAAGAYTFRHIVIREVAYATLPRAERVRGHVRLASWLEGPASEAGSNELAELIAYHYRQALALSPGGRVPDGLDVATVVGALERAAMVAASGGAYVEAAQQIREAIRIAPDDDRLRLHELLGDAMQFGDDAINGYAEAFERWETTARDPTVGARLLVKRLGVAGRWSGSITHVLEAAEFRRLGTLARTLLDAAPDPYLEAKLACANAFEETRTGVIDRAVVEPLLARVTAARELFRSQGDSEAESESLDALAAIHRTTGDYTAALAAARHRLAMAERLGLLERIDAAAILLWDLVYLGHYAEAVDAAAAARGVLRAGEPEYMLMHADTWGAYAAMLCGRWDDALRFGDRLVQIREEAPFPPGRFTYPGWTAALRVASARQDATRVARYRSSFRAIAKLDELPGALRPLWLAILDSDARSAREALRGPTGSRDRKAELIALILFDAAETIDEEDLASIEAQSIADPPVMRLRIELARALNEGAPRLRAAVATLSDADHLADAARAAALLALRTHDLGDRADAERRLSALGDRAYLQKLAEEW